MASRLVSAIKRALDLLGKPGPTTAYTREAVNVLNRALGKKPNAEKDKLTGNLRRLA